MSEGNASSRGALSCRQGAARAEYWSNPQQRAVAEFHRVMGISAAEEPTMLTPERGNFRCRLIEEEVTELREATRQSDWLAMVDALVDIIYVAYGTGVELGVDLEPFFDEVHRANLRKIGASAGGKSIKPPGWVPPDLEQVYRRLHGDAPIPPVKPR
ncbi:MAG TPA: nucleotide pyrophosphohydrolase [Chloroflexota bacterium]|nr:nucleotide pyrophosphohydrolase [Chloroflexota bacterium]